MGIELIVEVEGSLPLYDLGEGDVYLAARAPATHKIVSGLV